jgi:hypothetical protein
MVHAQGIVHDSLIAFWDAGNSASYNPSSNPNVWTDLVSGIAARPANGGPEFHGLGGKTSKEEYFEQWQNSGYWVANDPVLRRLGQKTQPFTFEAWFWIPDTDGANEVLFSNQYNGADNGFGITMNRQALGGRGRPSFSLRNSEWSSGREAGYEDFAYVANEWVYMAASFFPDGAHNRTCDVALSGHGRLDFRSISDLRLTTTSFVSGESGQPLWIGRKGDAYNDNVRVAVVRIYNRQLSRVEMEHNFQAECQRFDACAPPAPPPATPAEGSTSSSASPAERNSSNSTSPVAERNNSISTSPAERNNPNSSSPAEGTVNSDAIDSTDATDRKHVTTTESPGTTESWGTKRQATSSEPAPGPLGCSAFNISAAMLSAATCDDDNWFKLLSEFLRNCTNESIALKPALLEALDPVSVAPTTTKKVQGCKSIAVWVVLTSVLCLVLAVFVAQNFKLRSRVEAQRQQLLQGSNRGNPTIAMQNNPLVAAAGGATSTDGNARAMANKSCGGIFNDGQDANLIDFYLEPTPLQIDAEAVVAHPPLTGDVTPPLRSPKASSAATAGAKAGISTLGVGENSFVYAVPLEINEPEMNFVARAAPPEAEEYSDLSTSHVLYRDTTSA